MVFKLPTFGPFWHALHEHDYELWFIDEQVVNALNRQFPGADATPDVSRLNRTPGLRVKKSGSEYCLSCLAAFPNGEVCDFNLTVNAGRTVGEQRVSLVNSRVTILY